MNIPLLEKVKAAILAEPQTYNQAYFIEETPCGTTCCIAGHALLQAGVCSISEMKDLVPSFIATLAEEELDLTTNQRFRLFASPHDWPEPYRSRMIDAWENSDKDAEAHIAAARIDKFIATNGAV